jgi:hypothetical protein
MGLGITAIAQDAIAALGTPTTFANVTGLGLTANAGNITHTATGSVNVNGQVITTATGQLQVDPDVIVTGQQMTTNIGPYAVIADGTHIITQGLNVTTNVGTPDVKIDVTASATGQNMNVSTGTVDAVNSILLNSLNINTSVGGLDFVITGSVQTTGSQMTLALGEEEAIIDVSVTASNFALSTSLNNVSVALNTPVDLTALPMTLNGGTVGSIAWSEVNTTTTNTWVEVDIAA